MKMSIDTSIFYGGYRESRGGGSCVCIFACPENNNEKHDVASKLASFGIFHKRLGEKSSFEELSDGPR